MTDKASRSNATRRFEAGAPEAEIWRAASIYAADLNRGGFAGYSDWRLPTLEEGASLLRPKERSHAPCIAPVFDAVPWWIWTSDTNGSAAAWCVFLSGYVDWNDRGFEGYVRVCRAVGQ